MIYELSISEERVALISVQADSEEEAISKAYDLLNKDDIDLFDIEPDIEVIVQNEVDEKDYGNLDGVFTADSEEGEDDR